MILKKFKLKNRYLNNRIIASPMCQYSAINGLPNKWHYMHYTKLISTGVSMLIFESTAINSNGRITHKDLVLSNNKQLNSFKKIVNHLKSLNNIPIGIQLSHSGRKGSAEIPWIKHNTPLRKKKWITYAPSSIKRDKKWPLPKKLSLKGIKNIKKDFINSAILSKKAGFDCVEVHMAHGYLLHQFLSSVSNKRNDSYGGNLKNRMNLPLQIIKGIKSHCKGMIIGARITGSDRVKGGIEINESIKLIKELEKLRIDYVCVSSGGIYPITGLKIKKGYNVDLAEKIKKSTKINIRVSGKIEDLNYGKKIIIKKKTDLVAIGRSLISNPNLIYNEDSKFIPKQYLRAFK